MSIHIRTSEKDRIDAQRCVDSFYFKNGKCCAGCDWWRYHNSVAGECTRNAPGPDGFPITRREEACGEFKDDFDWMSLPESYRLSIGYRKLETKEISAVSTEIKRYPIMRAIQKPNCYAGDDCDQIKPMWETHCEGDMGDSGTEESVDLDSNLFPPGTRITIAVPVCPECATPNQQVNMSKGVEPCECGFDWKAWTEHEYG